MGSNRTHECARCGMEFPADAVHTEIVRRDFVEVPRPSRIERLCRDCWEAYIADFLGGDFEALVSSYRAAESSTPP